MYTLRFILGNSLNIYKYSAANHINKDAYVVDRIPCELE